MDNVQNRAWQGAACGSNDPGKIAPHNTNPLADVKRFVRPDAEALAIGGEA